MIELYDLRKLSKAITEQVAIKIRYFWKNITGERVGLPQAITVECTWDILKMKKFIKKILPDRKIIISNIILYYMLCLPCISSACKDFYNYNLLGFIFHTLCKTNLQKIKKNFFLPLNIFYSFCNKVVWFFRQYRSHAHLMHNLHVFWIVFLWWFNRNCIVI